MSTYTFKDGTVKQGEICSECSHIIEGRLTIVDNRWYARMLTKDKEVTGLIVGETWIEFYNHMSCWRKWLMEFVLTDSKTENISLFKMMATSCYPDNQIMADLTIAQAILESNSGLSKLSRLNNNLFGIKGKGTAGVAWYPTKEWEDGEEVTEVQGFASNKTLLDSFKQHKKVLDLPRYVKVREAKTFEDAALQVRLAGYATDPSYTQELIDVYNQYIK